MTRKRLVDPLIYWARERESLRMRKARGEIPWTHDPILAKYRFCNLRRRDDRVSQWLIGNVLQFRHLGFSEWSFLQFTALCRWINWPPTLAALREVGLWPDRELYFEAIADQLDRRCELGIKTWTGAYMVRAAPDHEQPDNQHISKGWFVCKVVVEQGMESIRKQLLAALNEKSAEAVWRALHSAKNWGSFMAGQVVADWSYTPLLERAYDLNTWAPMGPGSMRGYNRLLGRSLKAPIPEDEWCSQLSEWRGLLIDALGPAYVNVTLHDVQNALCELDKYLRVKNGEGKPRSTYQPEDAY